MEGVEESVIALDRDGYVVIRNVLDMQTVDEMRGAAARLLELARRDPTYHAGGTLHVGLPIGNDSPFAPAWSSLAVLEGVRKVLGEAQNPNRADFRSPQPGYGAQMLHRDWPEPGRPNEYSVATLIVALCDFTETNGATRVVPGSQHLPGTPSLHDADTPHPQQRIIVCPAGSAILFNGHLWHSGTRNRSTEPRDALQIIFQRS